MTIKKIVFIITIVTIFCSSFSQFAQATQIPGQIYQGEELLTYRNVTVYAPAVASTESGYVGVISTITVTIQSNGNGRVFVDTLPLTQVDMQGSARLAVKVASALVENDVNCSVDPSSFDYFFVVRTSAPIIGGPSAGAIMTVATISLLENWTIDNRTVMTGMINPDGSIGPIGGIPQKIDAAYDVGAERFLIPKGQGTYETMETITLNGGTTIITRPVLRSVSDYAKQYDIEVVEVAEINEAVENFTGYNFPLKESDTKITTQDYIESMKPLASTLLTDAREMYENASSNLENTTIPNNYPNFYQSDVLQRFQIALSSLEESEKWYDSDLYYTSTSKSFQSLISSRTVIYACEFFNSVDSATYIEDLIEEVESLYNSASDEAKNSEVNGFITLQTVGAAQRRATEAKLNLDAAKNEYQNSQPFYYFDVVEFLYKIAFTVERSNSIGWWLSIGSYFSDTGDITEILLENLALEYISEAEQSAIYSGIIVDEIGVANEDSSSYLSSANTLLDSARSDLENDYPAAALFEALEALVKANLALEIIGFEAEDRIEISRERASGNIAESREQGIEPLLAVSYYEYAESLSNESAFDSALIYYKYSGMIAGALGFTNVTTGTASSRYVGIPEIKSPNTGWLLENFEIVTSIAILSVIAGLGIGLIISGIAQERKKRKTTPKWKQKYIEEYEKIPRHPYFSDKDMPRSIRDYYKKNK